jgi:hypothetical protein
MARRAARRRLFIGLTAALLVNAALLALLAPAGREVWRMPADADVAMRLELTREPLRRSKSELARSADGPRPAPAQRSLKPSTEVSIATSAQALPAASATPSTQSANIGSVQGGGEADLQAKMALALRKLGACSRMNSGTGDAQDKALCTRNFATADGATIDAIPIGKRADYDAAHAKAGYLVPADAANPNFVTSQFKRGGTVWSIHAGCGLVQGKWHCGVH